MNIWDILSECGKRHMIPVGVNLSSGLFFYLFLLHFASAPQSGTFSFGLCSANKRMSFESWMVEMCLKCGYS